MPSTPLAPTCPWPCGCAHARRCLRVPPSPLQQLPSDPAPLPGERPCLQGCCAVPLARCACRLCCSWAGGQPWAARGFRGAGTYCPSSVPPSGQRSPRSPLSNTEMKSITWCKSPPSPKGQRPSPGLFQGDTRLGGPHRPQLPGDPPGNTQPAASPAPASAPKPCPALGLATASHPLSARAPPSSQPSPPDQASLDSPGQGASLGGWAPTTAGGLEADAQARSECLGPKAGPCVTTRRCPEQAQ